VCCVFAAGREHLWPLGNSHNGHREVWFYCSAAVKSLFRPRGGPKKLFLKVSFKEALKTCKLKLKDRLN
jgi:hypothetical protein